MWGTIATLEIFVKLISDQMFAMKMVPLDKAQTQLITRHKWRITCKTKHGNGSFGIKSKLDLTACEWMR